MLIPLTLFTLVLQSGMGAWAVKYPQTPPVMASHFGISLVCFAAVFLVMRVLGDDANHPGCHTFGTIGIPTLAWVTLVWAVVVAYIGAYMRHSGAELACHTWPLCNGSLIPDLSSPGVAVAWGHRLAALIALALVASMFSWSRHRRHRARTSTASASGPLCSSSPRPPAPWSSSPASRWRARSATLP